MGVVGGFGFDETFVVTWGLAEGAVHPSIALWGAGDLELGAGAAA